MAQPYNCGENCQEVPNPPFETEIFPGCTAIINYVSGDCLDGKCRIRITSIHFQGNCTQFTINELINLSAIKLIEQWQIKTSCSDQEEPVKLMDIYMAPCMKWVGILGTNGIDASLVPCTHEGCCVSRYIATRQGNKWNVTRVFQQITGLCTENDPGCITTCE